MCKTFYTSSKVNNNLTGQKSIYQPSQKHNLVLIISMT